MDKLNVYLASRWEDKEEVAEYRDYLLKRLDFNSTGRWIDAKNDPGKSAKGKIALQVQTRDIEDIDAADVFVVFSPKKSHGNGSGGRHVELGYAIGTNKIIFLVGYRENVFHWNKKVKGVKTVQQLVPHLKKLIEEKKIFQKVLRKVNTKLLLKTEDGLYYDGYDHGIPPRR